MVKLPKTRMIKAVAVEPAELKAKAGAGISNKSVLASTPRILMVELIMLASFVLNFDTFVSVIKRLNSEVMGSHEA